MRFSFLFCLQSEMVLITGPAKNCTEAKIALEKKVQELEAEKEDRVSRSWSSLLY